MTERGVRGGRRAKNEEVSQDQNRSEEKCGEKQEANLSKDLIEKKTGVKWIMRGDQQI